MERRTAVRIVREQFWKVVAATHSISAEKGGSGTANACRPAAAHHGATPGSTLVYLVRRACDGRDAFATTEKQPTAEAGSLGKDG